MTELKTQKTTASPTTFLNKIGDKQRRADCFAIMKIMEQLSKSKPKMWGPSIIGFGDYHYHYASGREGDWFLLGFSPRKQSLTLYIMGGFAENSALMKKLGKYKTGKCCLYIKSLNDIHMPTLTELCQQSLKRMEKSLP